MSIELIPATDPQAYNDVVAAMPLSSPLQGWGYGEARRVLGQTPERYLLRRSGETVGAVQLIRKRLLPGFSTLYAPRGPALLNTDLLPEFGQAVQAIRRAGDTLLKIEPPLAIPADNSQEVPAAFGRFERAATEQPEHTIIRELSGTEDALFGACTPWPAATSAPLRSVAYTLAVTTTSRRSGRFLPPPTSGRSWGLPTGLLRNHAA
ncbi:hypothetical protein [Deinococcus radiophilus]|uniref:hypothetical protein n=1 Tax=Deinococcus radiophilus TaxID=32062 RepID=UPI003606A826